MSQLLKRMVALAALTMISGVTLAEGHKVDVYKSPYCGCCHKWVDHMRSHGFEVVTHDVSDVGATRASLGMPATLGSCHTATVDGYVLEGHVPAEDVERLLKEHPAAVGLAVPGMPAGSPGMEGARSQAYDTLLVKKGGATSVFAAH